MRCSRREKGKVTEASHLKWIQETWLQWKCRTLAISLATCRRTGTGQPVTRKQPENQERRMQVVCTRPQQIIADGAQWKQSDHRADLSEPDAAFWRTDGQKSIDCFYVGV